MLNALFYGAYGLVGFFGLKLIFWDIPIRNQSYWKGVGKGAGGILLIVSLAFAFTHYFVFALIAAVLAAIVIFLLKSR